MDPAKKIDDSSAVEKPNEINTNWHQTCPTPTDYLQPRSGNPDIAPRETKTSHEIFASKSFANPTCPAASVTLDRTRDATSDEIMSDNPDVEEAPQSPAKSLRTNQSTSDDEAADFNDVGDGEGDLGSQNSRDTGSEAGHSENEDDEEHRASNKPNSENACGDDYDYESFGSQYTTTSTVEYDQEKFETYQHKVAQLCRDIGCVDPVNIQRMKGGGFNRIIGLSIPSSNKEWILRIPRFTMDDDVSNELKDQVDVLLSLSRHDFLHVPLPIGYDSTTNNSLKSPYVIQERAQGTSLGAIFYTLPMSEKLQITAIVAKMLLKLETITFERPGRLIGSRKGPDFSPVTTLVPGEISIAGYREDGLEDRPIMEKQSFTDFITFLLDYRKSKQPNWPKLLEMCDRLKAIAKEMESAGLVRARDNDSILFHWDLSAANIMIKKVAAMPETNAHEEPCPE